MIKPGDMMTVSNHRPAYVYQTQAMWRNGRRQRVKNSYGSGVLVLACLEPDDDEDVVLVLTNDIVGYMYASVLVPAWT